MQRSRHDAGFATSRAVARAETRRRLETSAILLVLVGAATFVLLVSAVLPSLR